MSLAAIFSRNLQALRKKKQLTQEELAGRAGISVAYVSMLERGQRTPPLETIDLLAKALKVPALDMLEKQTGKRS
jgi:transcriptional regulator with XRE-family HTH domain